MIASLSPGGSQSMVINLYKKIDRSKVQFDFIVDHTEGNELIELVESMGAKVYFLPTFKGYNILEIIKAWNEFFKTHKEYKVIHSHSRSYASIYLKIAKKYGLKTIIHSHSTSNGSGVLASIKNILQLPLRNIADYLFACSLDSGKWLYGEETIKKNNFYIINNAIDTDSYVYDDNTRNEYREKFNLKDEKVFIQVGRFIELKNFDFSVKVFNKYLENNPNSRLLLVGDGEVKKDIEELVNQLNLNDKVLLLGLRDDVNKLLQMADIFLMPSKWEGVSLAAIEAEASDINCLMSDKVSEDVKIIDKCKFIPLDIDKWIECINTLEYSRTNRKQDIVDAGYDAGTTASWLQNFYLKLYE